MLLFQSKVSLFLLFIILEGIWMISATSQTISPSTVKKAQASTPASQ